MIFHNKTCLKRSLSKFKSICCLKNPPMLSVPSDGNELATISSDVHEAAIPLPPPLIHEGDLEMFVTPATHLMTFIIFSISVMLMVGTCHSFGGCSETFKHFCRIFIASLQPAIWIWTNQTNQSEKLEVGYN